MKKNKQEMTMQQEMTTKTKFSNEVTVQVFDAVMLLRNTNLTALEMVEIISTLEDVVDDLYNALIEAFPQDEMCGDCSFCDGYMEDNINVPDWAKAEAGIAPDAKLFLCIEEGSGHIMLEPTEYKYDITDIDEDMRMRLMDLGICLGEMNESIMDEDVIYRG